MFLVSQNVLFFPLCASLLNGASELELVPSSIYI